ncbi:MAG: hypothetical protein QOI59_4036 [Gammaproteobacteria bacterium]|nr:hypothetical protein [Gammaproteobacteria bacterium]
MISQRFASAVGLSAAVAMLSLAGCGSVGVALGMRTRLDKLPITAVSATLSPHPSLTPGKSGRLIIVATGSDGAAGKIIVTVDPSAQVYLNRLHFSARGGFGSSAPEFHTESVPPLW